MAPGPAVPGPRRFPLWLLVPLALFGGIALLLGAVVLSVNVDAECDRAERLIGSFHGDVKVLLEAQNRLKMVLVTHPMSARGWSVAAELARVSGDPGDGDYDPKVLALMHECARKGIKFEPRSVHAHLAEGWAYACAKDWPMAREEQRRAETIAPDDPRVRLLGATLSLAERRPAEGIAALESVVAAADADSALRSDAWARLAAVSAELSTFAHADSCWREALALAPRATRVRERYARFLTANARHDDAIAVADEVVAIADNAFNRATRAAAHVGKGVWWIEARRHPADALAEFELACADRPDDAGIWYDIALAHVGLFRENGSADERIAAQAAIDRARRLAPGDADVKDLAGLIATLESEGAAAPAPTPAP